MHYNASEKCLDFALFLQYTANMPPRKKKKTPARALQVRVTAEEYARFHKAAEKDGRSLSSWVRHRLAAAVSSELR